MQVNSVSNYSLAPAFKADAQEKVFARLSDGDLRTAANDKASIDVDDKKHRRIDKALYYSLPLAGGISALARTKAFGPHARLAKLGVFASEAIGWAVSLAAIDAVFGAGKALVNHSESAKETAANHPILTSLATLGAGIGAVFAANTYGPKLINKAYDAIAKFIDKRQGKKLGDPELGKGYSRARVSEKLGKLSEKLNTSKLISKASDFLKKMPAPIKETGKFAAAWAPLIIVGTQIVHSFGHQKIKQREAWKNYDQLRQAQDIVRQDISADKFAKLQADAINGIDLD